MVGKKEEEKAPNVIISFGNGQVQNDYFGFAASLPLSSVCKCKMKKF